MSVDRKWPLLVIWLALFVACSVTTTPQEPLGPGKFVAQSDEQLIEHLAQAYSARSLEWFTSMLADNSEDPTLPGFTFLLPPNSGSEVEMWGYAEEALIHQRMFEPENTPPEHNPVPAELWLTGIRATLTQQAPFAERTDLYASPQNPDGLSPTKWKVTEATYATDVYFETQGDLDFLVEGRANFVVLQDLEKGVRDSGRFLLLQWGDLGSFSKGNAGEDKTWGGVKSVYK